MRCLSCNYDLRNLPENRCPECGREFDPNDPRTLAIVTAFPPPPISIVIFVGIMVIPCLALMNIDQPFPFSALWFATAFAAVFAYLIYLRFRREPP